MGYLFLSLALAAGVIKGYCGKRTSGFVTEYKDAMFTNLIRMVLCIAISLLLLIVQGNISLLNVDTNVLLVTLLSGVTTSVFVVTWLMAVKRGAYMMLDVFLMLGVTVPLILSSIIYDEAIAPNQWIGLVILFAAVLIMCSYNNQIKEKMGLGSIILLIVCGLSNGLTDFSQKLYAHGTDANVSVFNFYTYVFSALVLLVFFVFAKVKDTSDAKNSEIHILKRASIYVAVMSICLFANSFFKTKAAMFLPSAKLYPLNQGTALILSSFMSRFIFKEKLTARCIIGLCLSFVGLIVINVL